MTGATTAPPRYRIRPDAGWVAPRRGPTGGGPCRLCGLPVEKGRRTFHAVCAEHWLVTSNPGHVRRLVERRDHGVCARCGLDCTALYAELSDMRRALKACYPSDRKAWLALLDAAGCRKRVQACRSLWDAHHTHAVAEGGGLCELDGFETLCWRCHAAETAALRRRLNRTAQQKLAPQITSHHG